MYNIKKKELEEAIKNAVDSSMNENVVTDDFFEEMFNNSDSEEKYNLNDDTDWQEVKYYLNGINSQFEHMDENNLCDEEEVGYLDEAITKLYESWTKFKASF